MSRILVLYETVDGQTRRIAERMANELSSPGNRVDFYAAAEIPRSVRADLYDLAVIGAPVHRGRYPKTLTAWVKRQAGLLNRMPSAFFSVSLGILQDDPPVRADIARILMSFFRDTGWNPRWFRNFAGALAYSRYGWLKRRLLHWISLKAGRPTDLYRDHDYTDWSAVKDFAAEIDSNPRSAAPLTTAVPSDDSHDQECL